MKKTALAPHLIASSSLYRQVMAKIPQPHKPLPLLRGFFGVALGYPEPVSQTVFAGWLGVNRGLIANLETRKQKIPDSFADRVWRISGAPREWLRGHAEIGSYGYADLQHWFPKSFPQTEEELNRRFMDSAATKSKAIRYWRDVIEPALTYAMTAVGEESTVEPFMMERLKAISGACHHCGSKPGEVWKAYAFADQPSRVSEPLEEGLLDEVIAKATAMGHQVERSNHGEVLHFTIFLRGLAERQDVEHFLPLQAVSAAMTTPSAVPPRGDGNSGSAHESSEEFDLDATEREGKSEWRRAHVDDDDDGMTA